MALTGHLSDLSLSELIEFFCNQRKTGQLKVLYPKGSGHFYLQTGSVIDAKIGVLRGIDAVYYALTLPNARFEFSASMTDNVERTINQPWTQVVLEGLRRLDEGIIPSEAFPQEYIEEVRELESIQEETSKEPTASNSSVPPSLLSFVAQDALSRRKPFVASAITIAVLASIAAAGVPAGWYDRVALPTSVGAKTAKPAPDPTPSAEESETESPVPSSVPIATTSDAAALAAKRQRERERAKRLASQNDPTVSRVRTATSEAGKQGPKKVTVTVSFDESGRVTQASGSDPTALRIARQKRFPPGKAGSATVTIPIN
ncbi:MAG TPA: DUF4388 domain-containing protein [Pyrinomonadaceae bacterium]|nr:DUF4388 domain-containing protein [Pyrinomonadaceae bacterium]